MTKRSRVLFLDDPLRVVRDAFRNLYPTRSAHVVMQPLDGKKLGEMCFTPGRVPLVSIDPRQSYAGCIDVLAHELAHVAKPYDGHGRAWKRAYDSIRDEYHRIIQARCDRAGVKSASVKPAAWDRTRKRRKRK